MSVVGRVDRRQLARPRLVLGWLFTAHVVLKVILFFWVAHTPVVGDEAAYVDGARALSNLVRDLSALGPVDTAELQRSVVGSGWFMPGMSLSLTPLFVVDPDASITAVRAYLGVVSTLLLLVSVVSVRRVLGDLYAGALLVFPGLVPMWLIFSFASWGDLCAGLLIVIALTEVVTVFRRVRTGLPPTIAQGARLGLLAVAVVYARSSAMLVVVGLVAVVAIAVVALLRGQQRWRGMAVGVVALAVFAAVLAPWSVFASHTLGDRVLTTTSVPVVMANTFGDRDRLCFGPCDPGSTIWFNPLRYSREVAAATGRSELEVQRQMSAYARSDVTAHSYADDVLANAGRYALDPAGFAAYLHSPAVSGGFAEWLVVAATDAMFFALLAVALAFLLTVVGGPVETRLLAVVVKIGLLGLFTQPFVHICGSRYWTTAAPLLAFAAVVSWSRLQGRHRVDGSVVEGAADGLADDSGQLAWLARVQGVIAGVVGVVTLAVILLAI